MSEWNRGTKRLACLALLVGAGLASPGRAAAAEAAPTDAVAIEAAKATIGAIRNLGTAMISWVTDQPKGEGSGAPAAEGEADWSQCPPISHAEATELLVPKYIAAVPATDGWGNPLELCVRRPVPADGNYLVGVRSPGGDGKFEGTTYAVGAFDPSAFDRDVVWIDGYFMTWPQKKP